jgi:hypothetical protein
MDIYMGTSGRGARMKSEDGIGGIEIGSKHRSRVPVDRSTQPRPIEFSRRSTMQGFQELILQAPGIERYDTTPGHPESPNQPGIHPDHGPARVPTAGY